MILLYFIAFIKRFISKLNQEYPQLVWGGFGHPRKLLFFLLFLSQNTTHTTEEWQVIYLLLWSSYPSHRISSHQKTHKRNFVLSCIRLVMNCTFPILLRCLPTADRDRVKTKNDWELLHSIKYRRDKPKLHKSLFTLQSLREKINLSVFFYIFDT